MKACKSLNEAFKVDGAIHAAPAADQRYGSDFVKRQRLALMKQAARLKVGDFVTVKKSVKSSNAGVVGAIKVINKDGSYQVSFGRGDDVADYKADELELYESMKTSLDHMLKAFVKGDLEAAAAHLRECMKGKMKKAVKKAALKEGKSVSPELGDILDEKANGADEVEHEGRIYRREGPKNSTSPAGAWKECGPCKS